MSEESRRRALDTAANVLQYKQRSAAALYDRLVEKEIAPEDAEYAVARLRALGYLNDVSYAAAFARDLAARGYGRARVRAALREKKVAAEDIEQALEGFEPDREKLFAYISARLAEDPHPDRKTVKKISDGLFRRGFSWEEIRAALRDYLENDTNE